MIYSSIKKFIFIHSFNDFLALLLNINRGYLFRVEKWGKNHYMLFSDNTSIFISRPKRLFKYKNGIKNRFDQILDKYFVNEIVFLKDDVIIDCGSNIGELPLAIRSMNVEPVTIIAIEPDPIEFKILKSNLQKSDFLYNYFLCDKPGIATAQYVNDLGDSHLIAKHELFNLDKSTFLVTTHTLDTIFLSIRPDSIKLLKIEVEGFELEVLKGATEALKVTSFVAVDTGPERDGAFVFSEVNNFLTKAGFRLLKNNNNFSVLFVKI